MWKRGEIEKETRKKGRNIPCERRVALQGRRAPYLQLGCVWRACLSAYPRIGIHHEMRRVLNSSDRVSLALDEIRAASGCGTRAADEAGSSDKSGVSLSEKRDHCYLKAKPVDQ